MIHIYHPNKAVKGFACSFWFSERDRSFYASLIKQSGWDEKSQNGVFKDSLNDPNKKVSIKLSLTEVCAILDCIERNRPFNTYHDNENSPKSIAFTPWMGKPAVDDDGNISAPTQQGFSFGVTTGGKQGTDKNPFYIGLKYEEARLVREFIIYALHRYFERGMNQTTQSVPSVSVPVETTPAAPPTVNNSTPEPSNSNDPLRDW